MTHAIQLLTRLVIAKFRTGELTEEEFREAFAECVRTAQEHGVIPPSCFEGAA